MKVSELIRAMTAAGAPMEAVLIAVEALEQGQEAIEQRRAGERERKRRQRNNQKSEENPKQEDCADATKAVTVTGQSRDMDGTVTGTPALPLSSPQTPQLTPTHPDNNTRARKGTGIPAKPEGVSDQTWQDFADLRKRKRAPITPTVIAGIESEARKVGWTMEAALAKCVTRGWQGFEAGWVQGEAPPVTPGAPANDPLMRSIMALKAREASG